MGQLVKYMHYGLRNKQMMPDVYMEKLMDYKNETNKRLNHISSAYSEEACRNIIVEVGFGQGPLRRDHCYGIMEGVDYLILGQENPNNLGLPDLPSIEFSYENVTDELTFHWFKHHIMCRQHLWICDDESNNKEVPKNQKKNKPSGSGGSKKNRRKNKNSSEAGSSKSQTVNFGGSRRNLLGRLSSRKPEENIKGIKTLNRSNKN